MIICPKKAPNKAVIIPVLFTDSTSAEGFIGFAYTISCTKLGLMT